jgi:SAM-dependent methyltransferase
MRANDYSLAWFELFLESIQPVQTEAKIAFIIRHLPNPPYFRVLDLCCGPGRHAQYLADKNYKVVGVDINESALEKAKKISHGNVVYRKLDMRELSQLSESYDAVVNLWQSFGYFDDSTNAAILREINNALNPNGRLILDIYHREFFEQHQGERQLERNGIKVTETKFMQCNRLIVELDYADHGADRFEWQLFTPDEITRLGTQYGFVPLVTCTGFDEKQPASSDSPRMQLVFQKADK